GKLRCQGGEKAVCRRTASPQERTMVYSGLEVFKGMRGVQGKQLTSGTEPPATVLSKKHAVASRSSRRRILAGRARRQQPLLSAQAFYPNWRPRGCKSLHLQCWGRIGSSCAAVPSRSPSESTASSSGLVMASYQRRVVTSHACPPASPAP